MQAPPARFRHPLDAPDPVAVRSYGRFLRGKDRGNDEATVRAQSDALAAALWRGDPLMDAWVNRGRTADAADAEAFFERALRGGPDAVGDGPPELVALFERAFAVPLWLDAAQIALGARTARRAGPIAGIVLSGFSLMGGYRSSAVVKPLMMTGKLRYQASRRLTDTGRFVVAITEPNALLPPREGFQACLRIRYLHARIRAGLTRSPSWRSDAWGLPINQADMLGTNLLFSLGFLLGARTLGITFTRDEAESVIHLWRYVGHLLGIEESLLPASEREAERMLYLVGASQPCADEDSVALAGALHREPLERAHTDRERRAAQIEMAICASLSRLLLGDLVADELALPKSPLRFAARAVVPAVAALERIRKIAPFGDAIAYRLGERWIKASIEMRA